MTTLAAALVLLVLAVSPALAFDANQTFKQGNTVLSIEGGGGTQSNLQGHRVQTDLDAWYIGLRYSLLPLQPAGPSILRGSLELGLEPTYVNYSGGRDAYWAGLSARGRWHFLSLGRVVPYVELGAGAGGTDLRAIEIDSSFAFLLSVGVGASFFITDQAAIYAGYRMLHVSNGNTDRPNRGFELDTGVVGFSYYFK
ncbi:MAG: acyloxyacyl hydrolase [Candidatus Rokubacteria bacterium]|nr:acyloxyacyl hydrolase [Candidatus Rokubacteria bacterium]